MQVDKVMMPYLMCMFVMITWIVSVGFPTLATYKALKSNDLSLMRPWIMYWAVLRLAESLEFFLSPVLNYVIFYSWFRLMISVWLVSYGAVSLWTGQIEPLISSYEPNLDSLISKLWSQVGSVTRSPDQPAGSPHDGQHQYSASLFSVFRRPVSSDMLIQALSATWSKPASSEQASKQRSYLQAMLNALDKDPEEFIAVDNVPQVPAQRRWFW